MIKLNTVFCVTQCLSFASITPYFLLITVVFTQAIKNVINEHKPQLEDCCMIVVYFWLIVSTVLGVIAIKRGHCRATVIYASIQSLWLLLVINTLTAFLIAPSVVLSWLLVAVMIKEDHNQLATTA